MRLRTALGIYRVDGPDTTTGQAVTGGAPLATKVVHVHLTGEEIRRLLSAWKKRTGPEGKAEFFQLLNDAEGRLQAGGYI